MDVDSGVNPDTIALTIDSGQCNINAHVLDALIEPKKAGIYCLRYTYHIAEEIWVDNFQIKVKG